jgi:hypothetical protein
MTPVLFQASLRFVSFSFGRSRRNVVMADEKGVRYFVRMSDFEAMLLFPNTWLLWRFEHEKAAGTTSAKQAQAGAMVWSGYWLIEKKGSSYLTRPVEAP